MKKIISIIGIISISITALANPDYGLRIQDGTRIASTASLDRPIWSIEDVRISKQEEFRAILYVKVTIANGICGASQVHSKMEYIDGATGSEDGLTAIYNFGMSIVATGASTDWMKACFASSSGPVQVVIEIPVEIASTDPKRSVQYNFSAGKYSFSATGQFGKSWIVSRVQTR